MVKILFCDVSHLNKHGINSIELIWNTDVAVFKTSITRNLREQTHFTIANPTDWYWLTHQASHFDKELADGEVDSETITALQSAKQAWKSARRAARLVGLDWMDKAYFKISPMEYTDVFVRHNDAPFVVTQHCGIQLISCGEFAARLLLGYDWKFEHEDFVLTESNPQVIYVDIREDRSDLKTFIEQPEKFDGAAVEKILGCNGIRFKLDGGFRQIESDTYDFDIRLNRDGCISMPRYEVNFPYASLAKYAEEVKYNCKN